MIGWLLVILVEQILMHYFLEIIGSHKRMPMSNAIYKIAIFVYRINFQEKNIKAS